MLLYLVTKNHSFSDGNKRIAATLFLWFMNNNAILYRPDGTKRIADNTLVALTLMIAESKNRRKGYNGKGSGESYQPSQLVNTVREIQHKAKL